jgi:16S rRNA (guanine527-N7)-methyltransferase
VFHVERRELVEFFKTGTRDLFGVHLTDQQLEQFTTFLEQLKAWNQSTNLTSITSDEDIVVKHFIDSLAALSVEAMVSGAKILDVGSGAGFPGIPLKIARPDLLMTLLEPTYKKVAFLHFAIGVLRLPHIKVIPKTLEQFALEKGSSERFDYVVTRALKYDLVLKLAHDLMASFGKLILYASKPVSKSDIFSPWSIIEEFSFDLPRQGGKRVITVLQAAAG